MVVKVSKGKWKKYLIMRENRELAKHLPDTKILTDESLWEMIAQYRCVILKPSLGFAGHGVIKVSLLIGELYEIHFENEINSFSSKEQAFEHIKKLRLPKRRYIVQQWIPLATATEQKRPFDLRIMVQRMKGSPHWVITGHLAKVAAPGYFITNIATIVTTQEALADSSIKSNLTSTLLLDIEELALKIAFQLEKFYPRFRNIGLDIALDQNGGIWIIEANLTPSIAIFQHLKDKEMYDTIQLYKKRGVD